MSYDGSLLKFGSSLQYEIPTAYIIFDTYEPVLSKLDTDPKRSADNGTLVRNVVAEKAHCKMTIRALPEPAVTALMNELQSAVISNDGAHDAKEGAINVKFWVPKLGDYHTCICYIPDLTIKIKHIEEKWQTINNVRTLVSSKMMYDQFEIEFIEY